MCLRVYAIVRRPLGRRFVMRTNGVRLRSICAAGASAVVADCDGPVAPTLGALREHDTVVRRVARIVPAVLPVRFGTFVDSDRSLAALLDPWSDDLQKALALVDGHQQMTLRLFARAGVPAARPVPVERDDDIGKPSGTRYLTRRARAQALAQSAPELETLRQTVAPLVAAERIARHDRGPLILTAYHLIPRTAVAAYRRIVRGHASALDCRVVLSGPWPPYAFVPELRR